MAHITSHAKDEYLLSEFKPCGGRLPKTIKLTRLAAEWAGAAYNPDKFASSSQLYGPAVVACVLPEAAAATLAEIGGSRILSNHMRRTFPPILAAVVYMLDRDHFRQALAAIVDRLAKPVFDTSCKEAVARLNLPAVLNYVCDPQAVLIVLKLVPGLTVSAFETCGHRSLLTRLLEHVPYAQVNELRQLIAGFPRYVFGSPDIFGDMSTPPQLVLKKYKSVDVMRAVAEYAPREAMKEVVPDAIARQRLDVLGFLVEDLGLVMPQDPSADCYDGWLSTRVQAEFNRLGKECVKRQLAALALAAARTSPVSPIAQVMANQWLRAELGCVLMEHLVPVPSPCSKEWRQKKEEGFIVV